MSRFMQKRMRRRNHIQRTSRQRRKASRFGIEEWYIEYVTEESERTSRTQNNRQQRRS